MVEPLGGSTSSRPAASRVAAGSGDRTVCLAEPSALDAKPPGEKWGQTPGIESSLGFAPILTRRVGAAWPTGPRPEWAVLEVGERWRAAHRPAGPKGRPVLHRESGCQRQRSSSQHHCSRVRAAPAVKPAPFRSSQRCPATRDSLGLATISLSPAGGVARGVAGDPVTCWFSQPTRAPRPTSCVQKSLLATDRRNGP
jgi:hypothetical protein